MSTPALSSRYWAYLLRAWQEPGTTPSGTPTWRFIVEDPHTNRRFGFASVDALIAFLYDNLGEPPGRSEEPPDEPADDGAGPDRPAEHAAREQGSLAEDRNNRSYRGGR